MPEIVRLAILESYGVRWSRATFARDVLQNFFDATPDFRAVSIRLDRAARRIEVAGPVTFDLELLAYVGATTKTGGATVGGFGEGFKICALVGTRDFGLTLTAGSADTEFEVFFAPVSLGRELCYRLRRRPEPFPGSFVRLDGCDDECLAAFEGAAHLFRHPGNPKLLPAVAEDAASGAALLPSPLPAVGEIYYRRQFRGTVRYYGVHGDRPLTLAHDAVIEALEGDRDRRDLPATPIAEAIGAKLAPESLYRAFEHLMPYWEHGNEVLQGLLEAARARALKFTWPKEWLARAKDDVPLTRFAERQGFKIALAGFAALGMPTPLDHYRFDLVTRAPTGLERARIQVVADLYRDLTGKASQVSKYEVFDGKAAVHGQHLGDRVLVEADLLKGDMDRAAGTVLHELAHEAGGEEATGFFGRLRQLIAGAIRHPALVRAARRRYAQATPADAPGEAAVPQQPLAAYEPEEWPSEKTDLRGVHCDLFVPPAFPPSAELIAALQAAAEETGVGVEVWVRTLTGPLEAEREGVPGLPTLLIGAQDVEPPTGPAAEPGYRLRTYGPDGKSLCPSAAAIRSALLRAAEAGLRNQAAFEAGWRRREEAMKRFRARHGMAPPKPRRTESRAKRERREVESLLENYTGWSYDLDGFWCVGLRVAGYRLIAAQGADPRDAETRWAEIKGRLQAPIELARALRGADTAFDDADALDRNAMAAAQGAAVAAWFDRRGRPRRADARRAYRTVRGLTARILELEMRDDLRQKVLERALDAAGLDHMPVKHPRPANLRVLEREFRRVARKALELVRRADEAGRIASHWDLEKRFESKEDQAASRRREEERQTQARHTREIRAAYEETLGATGDPLAAAERVLAEAARRFPEPKAEAIL